MEKTEFSAKDRLINFGVKPSLQRLAIMDFLMKNPIHPTVDTIYNELHPSIPTLSKTTVYNTLNLLEERNIIQGIYIDDKNVRYDADIAPHAHFKCRKCGKIIDIPIIDSDTIEIKNAKNYAVIDCHVYYFGCCDECNKKIN